VTRRKRTTTEQGLGWEHQQRRRALLPLAYGKVCPGGCGRVMTADMKLDLDHSVPRALGGKHGDRIVCSSCNRSAGARLGNRLRKAVTTLTW
jgi:5-methylcytosine-specific restriction endonuclease McrA